MLNFFQNTGAGQLLAADRTLYTPNYTRPYQHSFNVLQSYFHSLPMVTALVLVPRATRREV